MNSFHSAKYTPASMPLLPLEALRHRLYCVWQTATYGDDSLPDHFEHVGEELGAIWDVLDTVIYDEKERLRYVEEEMRKFEEGFAYKPSRG